MYNIINWHVFTKISEDDYKNSKYKPISQYSVLFGSWLSSQGLNECGQYVYMKSRWLNSISKGGYKIYGTELSLLMTVSSYITQLGRNCMLSMLAIFVRGYSLRLVID